MAQASARALQTAVQRVLHQPGLKLTGAGKHATAEFGVSVALSADGNTALIGGPVDLNGAGAAWVFTRSGSTWAQQVKKLTVRTNDDTGSFGQSVALTADGNTAPAGRGKAR